MQDTTKLDPFFQIREKHFFFFKYFCSIHKSLPGAAAASWNLCRAKLSGPDYMPRTASNENRASAALGKRLLYRHVKPRVAIQCASTRTLLRGSRDWLGSKTLDTFDLDSVGFMNCERFNCWMIVLRFENCKASIYEGAERDKFIINKHFTGKTNFCLSLKTGRKSAERKTAHARKIDCRSSLVGAS